MARRIESSATINATAAIVAAGVVTSTVSHATDARIVSLPLIDQSATVYPPTIERGVAPSIRKRAFYERILRLYPPAQPGDVYIGTLTNPDTGLVDIAIHADRAELLRRLAEPFEDDTA
jgi:hypothetical protein